MRKIIYNGGHKLFYELKSVSELVAVKQDDGQEKEIYHHPYGITLDFYNFWNKDEGTRTILTCFGSKKSISKLEASAQSSPMCTTNSYGPRETYGGSISQQGAFRRNLL